MGPGTASWPNMARAWFTLSSLTVGFPASSSCIPIGKMSFYYKYPWQNHDLLWKISFNYDILLSGES